MAIINYFLSDTICYLGCDFCPICQDFTDFYLKENKNQTVTFFECAKCHKKKQIAEELSITSRLLIFNMYKNMPSQEENKVLFNTIEYNIKKNLEKLITNLSKSTETEAYNELDEDIKSLKKSILRYAKEKNYNEKYVSNLFSKLYIYEINNIETIISNLKSKE